jgi:hypothetical protein
MCRNIKPLFNYDPPVTDNEIHASALQYVRKVSGFRKPSNLNSRPFETAVDDIARITKTLIGALQTEAPPRDRDAEIRKAAAGAERRFSRI